MERKNAWEGYSTDQLEELDGLASRYIDYISNNKTERPPLSRQKLRAMNRLRMWFARAARSKRVAKYGLACMVSRSFWLISVPSRLKRA